MAQLRGGSTVDGSPILGREARDNYIGKIIGNKIKESLLYDDGATVLANGAVELPHGINLNGAINASISNKDGSLHFNGSEFRGRVGGTYNVFWTGHNFNPTSKVDTGRTISAGTGLTGGGNLTANRAISLDIGYTDARYMSLNNPNGTHTVYTEFDFISMLHKGDYLEDKFVPMSRNVSTGTGLTGGGSLTANRTLAFDTAWGDSRYANATISITAGNGLSGGGTLAGTRTLTLGTPSTLTPTTTNSVTATSHTHDIATATQAEAEAGTINSKFMTPLTTMQAIEVKATAIASSFMNNVSGNLNFHTSDRSNPHNVTSQQVNNISIIGVNEGTGAYPTGVTTFLQNNSDAHGYPSRGTVLNVKMSDLRAGQLFIQNYLDGERLMYRDGHTTGWTDWKVVKAVVEQGENSNGHYIKYSDGTMICWGRPFSLPTDIAVGNIFRSETQTWTYPASFDDKYPVVVTGDIASISRWMAISSATSGGSCGIRAMGAQSTSSSYNIYVQAFGRWR